MERWDVRHYEFSIFIRREKIFRYVPKKNLINFFLFCLKEILPLVEFALEEGITDEEAVKLIESPPTLGKSKESKQDGWVQSEGENYQMLHFEENSFSDPFTSKIVNFEVGFS